MRIVLTVAIALLCFLPSAKADDKKEEKRTIEIFMQQKERKDGSIKFYMWVKDEDAEVIGSAPDIGVGYSFGKVGAVYLESDNIGNAMFLVHPCTHKKAGPYTRIEFGGSRPNDIHIYLPKDNKGSVRVSSIKYSPSKPTTEDDE